MQGLKSSETTVALNFFSFLHTFKSTNLLLHLILESWKYSSRTSASLLQIRKWVKIIVSVLTITDLIHTAYAPLQTDLALHTHITFIKRLKCAVFDITYSFVEISEVKRTVFNLSFYLLKS